jgi:hypothetical protein
MSEPDFAGLRTVAEQAVRQPGFAAIERLADRRRGRMRLAAAAAAAVAVTAVAGTTALAVNRAAPRPSDVGTTGSVPPRPAGSHLASYAGDGRHLYVTFECPTAGCPALYASDDGGRHWQRRTLPDAHQPSFGPVAVLGPRTLLMSDRDGTLFASTDGGGTWRPVGSTTTPIEVAPAGQRALECVAGELTEPCAVQTLDGELRVAPLANQPPIDVVFVLSHVPADAGLWVVGVDRSTRKPALAVSRNQGRSWHVSVFPEAAPITPDGGSVALGDLPQLYTSDGRTAYVMQVPRPGSEQPLIFRSGDGGGTWRLIHQGEMIPPLAFVTRDGAHVLFERGDDGGVVATRASHNGAPYRPARLIGLPGGLNLLPTPLGGGRGFIAHSDRDPEALYVSDDGWTYRRLDVPSG